MKTRLVFFASIFAINSLRLVAQPSSVDYFGQTPPGDTAKIFAPGTISVPNRNETIIAFYPDGKEFYILENKIRYAKYINNAWTAFADLPFNVNQGYNEFSFSANGKKLFITKFSNNYTIIDVWVSNRVGESWGQPTVLPVPINSTGWDMGYSETADSLIYICSDRPGGMGGTDIYCIRRMPDQSLQAKNLGSAVNTSSSESIPCISSDGSYLVFSSERPGKYGLTDLYVTFNKGNNEWTAPINLEKGGSKINLPSYAQGYVSISPDGKYLFFNRHQQGGGNQDIYWVSTHIFDVLKKQAFTPKLSTQIPNMNVKIYSAINFEIPTNTFTCEYGADLLKYTATLKNGEALPSWLSFNEATRKLTGTPNKAGTDSIKISVLNKDGLSVSCNFNITTSFDYFGQTPPGDTAKIFAPGIVYTTNCENTCSFSPDGKEMVFTRWIGGSTPKLFFSEYNGSTWSTPAEKNFTGKLEMEAIYAPYGNQLLFASGSSFPNDIYMVNKGANGWETPKNISSINTTSEEFYASLTMDTTMYFQKTWNGIYSSKFKNGAFETPVKLSNVINSSSGVNRHPYISKDGSYLIFDKGDGNNNDIWISFLKTDKTWTIPIAFGNNINTSKHECQPTLSPDEKYLFFRSDCKPYWVKIENAIIELRKQAFAPKLSIQIPNMSVKTNSTLSCIIPSNTFTCEYGADALQYTATLKNGSALPSWLTFNAATLTLSGTPKQVAVDSIKITATNKDNVSATCTFKIEVSPATGIEKMKAQTIDIFPNPSSGVFNIHIGSSSVANANVEIYDFTGKMVLSNEYRKGVIDLTGYQNGIYVAKIMIGNEVFTKKLTIN